MLTRASEATSPTVTCQDVQRETFAACDGELTAEVAAALDRHLSACEPCRARVSADAVFHAAVRRAVSVDAAPPSLRERVAHLLHTPATENASA